MDAMAIKIGIFGVLGIIGGFVAHLFGGWTVDLTSLLICMLIDYVTGVMLAVWRKKSPKSKSGGLSSDAGFKGICKKIVILFCVIIAYRIDLTLGLNYIKTAAVIAFMVNELLSIVENTGLMGVPWPPAMLKAIDLLKNKKDGI